MRVKCLGCKAINTNKALNCRRCNVLLIKPTNARMSPAPGTQENCEWLQDPPQWYESVQVKAMAAFLVIAVVGLGVYHMISVGNNRVPDLPKASKSIEKVELLQWKWGVADKTDAIIGTVRNNTDQPLRYVQVSFNIYNNKGAQITTAFTNTTNLAPHSVWEFRAIMLLPDDVEGPLNAKLGDLTGY